MTVRSLKPDISAPELGSYVLIWLSAVLYSIYQFYRSSNNYFHSYDDGYGDFMDGWTVLGRKKDVADFEWHTIGHLIGKFYLWAIVWVAVSEMLRKLCPAKVPLWQISLSVVILTKEIGAQSVLVILFQPAVFLMASSLKSTLAVWIYNGTVLLIITLYKFYNETLDAILTDGKSGAMEVYFTVVIIFWMNLRCVSYSLDHLGKEWSPVALFWYCLYFPTLISGPFISYGDFKDCNVGERCTNIGRFRQLGVDLARFLFWYAFTEFALHYVYVNAANFHPQWIQTLGSWSLYGYGYCMGQFFHLKYVVSYGLATSLAKFEGVKVPNPPKCIGRIHLYSDMWRYFDAGLHFFLLHYIYVPSMKSGVVKSRVFSSMLCFAFIYVWHGTEQYILVWTCLNYAGVMLESLGKNVYMKYLKHTELVGWLGDSWVRRISCMLATPVLAMSILSNYYFLARMDVGNIFVSRVLGEWFSLNNVVLCGALYCLCQISTELREGEKRKIA